MWYVIVFCAAMNLDGSQPMYVFTDPSFATEKACRYTLTDKPSVQRYVDKIVRVYDGTLPGPIRGVNCIPQKLFDELEQIRTKEEKGISL